MTLAKVINDISRREWFQGSFCIDYLFFYDKVCKRLLLLETYMLNLPQQFIKQHACSVSMVTVRKINE